MVSIGQSVLLFAENVGKDQQLWIQRMAKTSLGALCCRTQSSSCTGNEPDRIWGNVQSLPNIQGLWSGLVRCEAGEGTMKQRGKEQAKRLDGKEIEHLRGNILT